MARKAGCFLLLIFLVLPNYSWAKQISFQVLPRGGGQALYHYRFEDAQGKLHDMQFLLDETSVPPDLKSFNSFSNEELQKEVIERIKAIAKEGFPDLTVSVGRSGTNSVFVDAKGYSKARIKQAIDFFRVEQERVKDEVLIKSYYVKDNTGNFILPDHVRIAQAYDAYVEPLALAIDQETQGMEPRDKVNFLLNFLQSIPYDQLLSRQYSNGSGFATPRDLLLKNRGDCDSKAVAFAAVMHRLMPDVTVMIVYIKDHAFIGATLPVVSGDKTIRSNNQIFVLAEPVGPAMERLGEISEKSRKELLTQRFSFKLFEK